MQEVSSVLALVLYVLSIIDHSQRL